MSPFQSCELLKAEEWFRGICSLSGRKNSKHEEGLHPLLLGLKIGVSPRNAGSPWKLEDAEIDSPLEPLERILAPPEP